MKNTKYLAVGIGVSRGGMDALFNILPFFPKDFPLPIFIIQHRTDDSGLFLEEYCDDISRLLCKRAEDGEKIAGNKIYFAPPASHLLINKDFTLKYSDADRVNYAKPSIDVFFDSAANIYQDKLLAVILTGSNNDGVAGVCTVKRMLGTVIVQSPESAVAPELPASVIKELKPDAVIPLDMMGAYIVKLVNS